MRIITNEKSETLTITTTHSKESEPLQLTPKNINTKRPMLILPYANKTK